MAGATFSRFLGKVASGVHLSRREAAAAMDLIMDGAADDAQIAAFAVAMRMKSEIGDEVAGCAAAQRRRAEPLPVARSAASRAVDTCGTGGDALDTVNVSTLAAIVAAGAGLPVAKHDNRSVSSRCGSADLLETLGIPAELPPKLIAACLETTGLAFLFAPRFHPGLRHAAVARRSLGMRTIFNLLGPLCNPAGAKRQVLGVYDRSRLKTMAQALRALGASRTMVVHGSDGMDELTVTGPSSVAELRNGRIPFLTVRPEDVGLCRWRLAALNVSRAASTLKEGVGMAAESIDRGMALAKLDEVRAFCNRPAGESP